MSLTFRAISDPNGDVLKRIAATAPGNPFLAPAFAASRVSARERVFALCLFDAETLVRGCLAYLKHGRLTSTLRIRSIAGPPLDPHFWNGLETLCHSRGVDELEIHSFGSEYAEIPVLGHERWRRSRCEFVLPLSDDDMRPRFSANHRRNIRRAVKNGMTFRTASDSAACETHVRLMSRSMGRRQERGESVTSRIAVAPIRRLVESGAGFFYQACADEDVLSSVLVLMSESAGYYHSAGTSAEGMKAGASQFLIWRGALDLRARGCSRFNLGGADAEQEGLLRFKTGFGTVPVNLEAAAFFVGSPLKRRTVDALRELRTNAEGFLLNLLERTE